MRPWAALASLALAVAPAAAQEETSPGTGAVLRGLDKMNGQVVDLDLAAGESAAMGRLLVRVHECRYPQGDPARDAFALLTIRDAETGPPLFEGWMVASSPALNALEHSRYDIWVLRCKTEDGS